MEEKSMIQNFDKRIEDDLQGVLDEMSSDTESVVTSETNKWKEVSKLYRLRDINKKLHYSIKTIGNDGVIEGVTDEGVVVRVTTKKVDGGNFTEKERDVLFNFRLRGYIEKIDEDNRIVYVSGLLFVNIINDVGELDVYVRDEHGTSRKRIISYITKRAENHEPVRLNARVIGYDEKTGFFRVSIRGLNVNGIIPIKEWSKGYTDKPKKEAEIYKGKYIQVEILRANTNKEGGNFKGFVCSRARCININEWEGIENRFKPGSEVIVKCLDKRDNYFFGKPENLQYISIMCYYPNNDRANIVEGFDYVVKIKQVSGEDQKLTARAVATVGDIKIERFEINKNELFVKKRGEGVIEDEF